MTVAYQIGLALACVNVLVALLNTAIGLAFWRVGRHWADVLKSVNRAHARIDEDDRGIRRIEKDVDRLVRKVETDSEGVDGPEGIAGEKAALMECLKRISWGGMQISFGASVIRDASADAARALLPREDPAGS